MNTEDDRKPAAASEEQDDSDVEIEGKFLMTMRMHCKKIMCHVKKIRGVGWLLWCSICISIYKYVGIVANHM